MAGPTSSPSCHAKVTRPRPGLSICRCEPPFRRVTVYPKCLSSSVRNFLAFKDYNPFLGESATEAMFLSEWIGFGNFQLLFEDPLFWSAVRNTLGITAFQLVFFFPLPIALALLLNSILSSRLRSVVQGIIYIPHFFSWVLVVTFFLMMLGGDGLFAEAGGAHRLSPE